MKQNKKIFSHKYFTQYYKPMIGNFSQKDLIRNRNWFTGWFRALSDWYDFKQGENKMVLEIGCSIGAASQLLSEAGFRVLGTDLSDLAVEKASKLARNVKFEKLDIEITKKYSNTFDLIFCFEVIEHLGDLEAAFNNIKRMLKSGGVFIASTPYPDSHVFIDETHINVRHPLDWERILKRQGFKKVKLKRVAFVPFFYRFSPNFHIVLPFALSTPYLNTPVFIYAEK